MKDIELVTLNHNKRKIQVVFALVLSLIVIVFIGRTLANLLNDGDEVDPNTQLTYYLDVSYDGVDKNGVQSSNSTVSEVRSGVLYVEDKLPDGLIFNGFVTTSDGSIGAVRRSDNNILCTGKVIDDTNDASVNTGTWNAGNTEYTYHGLHYDATTRTVSFQIQNLQAGCKLTVGIITTTPELDDPNTVEVETRRDFYNFATSREKNLIINSNTVHNYMKKINDISSMYNVSYQYAGTIPANAPSVPSTNAYVEGAKVGVANNVELEGYTFSGWTTSTTGVTVSNGSFTMPERDVVFTGSFTPDPTYNVTYSLTGTSPPGYTLPLQKSYYPNEVVNVDTLKVGDIVGGYRFLGWTTNTSGVVVDSSRKFVMPSSNVSFTGSFELITYNVSYQFFDTVLPPNASSYLPASQTVTPGTTVTLSSINGSASGYEFLGWYHDNNFVMPEENVVIYGEWREVQQTGTFTPTITKQFVSSDTYYHYGDTVQFTVTITNTANYAIENVLVRDSLDGAYFSSGNGYTLVTDSIASINTIAANSSFSLTVNYPVKVTDVSTVTNTVEIVSASADSNHSGYTLSDGDYSATASFTATPSHTVTYSLIGTTPNGYTLPTSVSQYPGHSVTVDTLAVGDVVNGYRFLGWSSNDVTISNGQFTMPNNNVSIVGEFELITYSLTYAFTGSTLPPNSQQYLPASQNYVPGVTVTLETIDNEPDGYEFMGWSSTSPSETISNGELTMPSENIVVYGTWREVGEFEPTITKQFISSDTYYHYGDTVQFTVTVTNTASFAIENVVVKEFLSGAEFVSGNGYTILQDGSAQINTIAAGASFHLTVNYPVKVTDVSTVTNTAKIMSASAATGYEGYTLKEKEYAATASFTASPSHTVTYSLIGTTPSGYTLPTSVSQYPGHSVTVDTLAVGDVVNGYRFLGWSSNDVTISNGQFTMPNNNVSIVGEFELITYSLTYAFTGSTLPPNSQQYLPASQNYVPGVTVTLETIDNEPDGYEFMGWSSTSPSETISNGELTMPSENIVVYGTWREVGEFEPTITKQFISSDTYYHYGDTVQFTVTVTNTASFAIENVVVKEFLSGAEFVSGNGYTILQDGSAQINTIAAGASFHLTVNYPVKVTDVSTVTNTAKIMSASAATGYEGYTLKEKEYAASASFTASPSHTVTYTITGTAPDVFVIPGDEKHYPGDTVTLNNLLSGTVVDGYRFSGWSSSDVTVTNNQLAMPTRDITVVGSFEPVDYSLTYQFSGTVLPPNSAVYLPASQNYVAGETVILETIDNAPNGYEFVGWTSTNPSVTINNGQLIMPANNIVVTGIWREVGTFEPTITKTVVNPKSYYDIGDTVQFRITVNNTADFAIQNVIVKEFLSGAEFVSGSGYTLLQDGTARIASIAASGSVNVNATYTVTSEDAGTITNTVKIMSASADSNHSGYTLFDKEYAATASFGLQPKITICKEITGADTGNKFQFHIEDTNHIFDTWIVLSKDECSSIYVEPATYNIFEVVPQEYSIKTISGAINSNGSNLVVQSGNDYTITYNNEFRRKNFLHSSGRVENTIENVSGVNSYNVIFHSNGGDGRMEDQEFEFEESKALRYNDFTHSTLHFAYWTTNQDGTGTRYDDGEVVSDLVEVGEDEIHLYAHWVDGVAMIGDTVYSTLSAAVSAVNRDSTANNNTVRTIKLLSNVNEIFTVNSGKNIVLNLQRHTVNNSEDDALITNGGTLTIKNGTISSDATAAATINNNSTLILEDATVRMTASGGKQAIYSNNAYLTVRGDSHVSTVSGAGENLRAAIQGNGSSGYIHIESGEVTSSYSSAIVVASGVSCNIGVLDTSVNISSPFIQGGYLNGTNTYGIENSSSINFYDGIVKGATSAIKNETNIGKETGASIVHTSETISSHTYDVASPRMSYRVTFNANGGTVSEAYRDVLQGNAVGALPTPTWINHRFDGWLDANDVEYDATSVINENVTLIAHWTLVETVRITFNANDGSVSEPYRDVVKGEAIGTLPIPERLDYTFDGWFDTNNQLVSATDTFNSNATLTAHWTANQYITIYFAANGGTMAQTDESRIITRGAAVGQLPEVSRANYTFDGWFDTNNQLVSPTDTFNGTTTLTAHWTAIEYVRITFAPNSGTVSEPYRDIVKGTAIGQLPKPTRSNYEFDYWYDANNNNAVASASTTFNSDATLTAHWTSINDAMYFAIGNQEFKTLANALTAVSNNTETTITFIRDVVATSATTVESTKNVILDLNGHTFTTTSSNSKMNMIVNKGTLRLRNGTITSYRPDGVINIESGGTLYIEDTVTINALTRAAVYNLSGTVYIYGGTITSRAEGNFNGLNRATLTNFTGSTMVITGGEIVNTAGPAVSSASSLIIGVKSDGIVSNTSPSFTGTTYGIESSGTLNFYDGIVKGLTGSIRGTVSETEPGTTRVDTTDGNYHVTYYN